MMGNFGPLNSMRMDMVKNRMSKGSPKMGGFKSSPMPRATPKAMATTAAVKMPVTGAFKG